MPTAENRRRRQLQGVAMIIVFLLVVGFVGAMFNGSFARTVSVTVKADRAGLLMDSGSKVKVRNVFVGKVDEVRSGEDGGALLTLKLEPDMVVHIPANVTAAIESTTVFGPKSVSLLLPEHPVATPISDGDVIERARPTHEFNEVFENLQSVLASIQPAKLNAALGAMATALSGRGENLGRFAGELQRYLRAFNPSLPGLERDMKLAGPVFETYADISPDVLRLLANLTVTGNTIVQQEPSIDAVLSELTGMAHTTGEVLADNESNLVTALDLLHPTADLLAQYSPVLPCFFQGVATVNEFMEPINGGRRPGISMLTTFLPGQKPYKNPTDLPVVAADNPPDCLHLPKFTGIAAQADHVYFNDGSTSFEPGSSNQLEVGKPPLAVLLFGPNAGLLGDGPR